MVHQSARAFPLQRKTVRLFHRGRPGLLTGGTPKHNHLLKSHRPAVGKPRTSIRCLAAPPSEREGSSPGGNRNSKRLDYEHGFHAGNFADVFKHVILVMLVQHMQKKSKPMAYVETHAGAGLYSLSTVDDTSASNDDARASTDHAADEVALSLSYQPECQRGIGALLDLDSRQSSSSLSSPKKLPNAIATYLDIVQSFQEQGQQPEEPSRLIYPGSPLFAASLLNNHTTNNGKPHYVLLYEKADSQFQQLQKHFMTNYGLDNAHASRYRASSVNDTSGNTRLSCSIYCDNGYAALSKTARTSPNPPARALVVIDPPYQYGSDTEQIAALCRDLQHHWRSARIAIWHPVRRDHADRLDRLYQLLRDSVPTSVEILTIEVYSPATATGTEPEDKKEDVGTGMILIQPPFGIKKDCEDVLPKLYDLLCHTNAEEEELPDSTHESIRFKFL